MKMRMGAGMTDGSFWFYLILIPKKEAGGKMTDLPHFHSLGGLLGCPLP